MNRSLTDEERFPLLDEGGRARLLWLREHPHAPRWNYRCGDRLDSTSLARIRAYAESLRTKQPSWRPGEMPDWVYAFAKTALQQVPIYRRNGGSADAFFDLPTYTHRDLDREPWSFVPDDAPLDGLIVYATSGTTGHPVTTIAHAETSAYYLPLIEQMLASQGLRIEGGPARVSLVTVAMQRRTFTIAAVSSYLNQAGVAKVNLSEPEWNHPDDRIKFLEDCGPEILTGDPIAFSELAKLPVNIRPKALLSTGMALLAGFRRHLEERFGCPVVEYYALTESGPVAMKTSSGWRLLAPDLFVEILHLDGTPAQPGERGEITLTGGRNPFFPLLRYRTGDWAALSFRDDEPQLTDIEGRSPVIFRAVNGRPLNNMDVTMALYPLALPQYQLHQRADGSLRFRLRGEGFDQEQIRAAIEGLFGLGQPVTVEKQPEASAWPDKVLPYLSDMA